MDVSRGDARGRHLGRPRTSPGASVPRRPLHRTASTGLDRGRQPAPSRQDDHRRPDDRVGRLVGLLVRPARRPDEPAVVTPASGRRRSRPRSTTARRSSGRVWSARSLTAGTYTLDLGRQGLPPAPRSSRGPTGRASTATSTYGTTTLATRRVTVAGPLRPTGTLHLPAMTSTRPAGRSWVVLPTYDEAENIGPIAARHPRGPPGGDAARRRRRLARRHRRAGRRPGRGRPADPGPPPAGQAGPRPRLSRRLRAWRSTAARRSSSRWTPTSATTRPSCPRSSRPIDDGAADLVIGSRYTAGRRRRRLGHRPADHLARRQPVRADRPAPRPERPDRRLQGVARRRRSRRSRSTASTPAATCSRSR